MLVNMKQLLEVAKENKFAWEHLMLQTVTFYGW